MSVLIAVASVLFGLGLFVFFWWAMIEAQEQAGIENENRRAWKRRNKR